VNADLFTPELAAKYQADGRQDSGDWEDGGTGRKVHAGKARDLGPHGSRIAVRDTNGQIVGVLGVFWDITERKRADNALQRQTAELKARNEELMRFNDAVVGPGAADGRAQTGGQRTVRATRKRDVFAVPEVGSQAPIGPGLRRGTSRPAKSKRRDGGELLKWSKEAEHTDPTPGRRIQASRRG